MEVFRLRVFTSTTQEDSLTQLFVSISKIFVSGNFCDKVRRS